MGGSRGYRCGPSNGHGAWGKSCNGEHNRRSDGIPQIRSICMQIRDTDLSCLVYFMPDIVIDPKFVNSR